MATLNVISSGSHGNAYILDCNNEQLIIELGVNWNDLLDTLKYDLSKVVACLSSHRHLDHSKSIPNAISFGLSVYSCEDVQTIHPQVKVLKKGSKTRIGGFKVQPIVVYHDVECVSFLIEHQSFGKLVFITDTNKIPYRFKGVNYLLVEANSDFDEMVDNMCENDFSSSHHENHMELSDTIDFLKENYTNDVKGIVLLHLSSTNINPNKARKKVQEELGFEKVFIAKKGLTLQLESDNF